MVVGKGVIAAPQQTYKKLPQEDTGRVKAGLQKIRAALVSDAKLASSRPSRLPKDWRNRVFK